MIIIVMSYSRLYDVHSLCHEYMSTYTQSFVREELV